MFATTGIIQGNTVLSDDYSLKEYDGKKVIITVLDDEKHLEILPNTELSKISDKLINQNMVEYKELAK